MKLIDWREYLKGVPAPWIRIWEIEFYFDYNYQNYLEFVFTKLIQMMWQRLMIRLKPKINDSIETQNINPEVQALFRL